MLKKNYSLLINIIKSILSWVIYNEGTKALLNTNLLLLKKQ